MVEVDETTDLEALLDELQPGEELLLTRRGEVVAMLVGMGPRSAHHPSSALGGDNVIALPVWMTEDLLG